MCQGGEKDPAGRTVIKGREVESEKERGMEGKGCLEGFEAEE